MESLTAVRAAGAAIVALSAALVGCGDDEASGAALPAVVMPALPGFAQTGADLDTSELEGPAVLNLWATWCVPCRTELPEFQRASREHPDVRFIGIDEGFEPGASTAFLDDLGVTYDQFVDSDGTFAEELDVAELPSTVVIDAMGSVVLHHTGAISYDELVAVIAEA